MQREQPQLMAVLTRMSESSGRQIKLNDAETNALIRPLAAVDAHAEEFGITDAEVKTNLAAQQYADALTQALDENHIDAVDLFDRFARGIGIGACGVSLLDDTKIRFEASPNCPDGYGHLMERIIEETMRLSNAPIRRRAVPEAVSYT